MVKSMFGFINHDVSYPTHDEIQRAVLNRPSLAWGRTMREQKSIRVLNLGAALSIPFKYLIVFCKCFILY